VASACFALAISRREPAYLGLSVGFEHQMRFIFVVGEYSKIGACLLSTHFANFMEIFLFQWLV